MMKRQKSRIDGSYKKFGKHSDSEDETELFIVKKKSPKNAIPTIDKDVEEGDTLQSLAIRYCSTVADLKRLNNIHKDNEIFAKRTIKVPHWPISMALAPVHISGRSSPHEPSASGVVDCNKVATSLRETELNDIIFNSSIQQKSVEIVDEGEDEEVRLLPRSQASEPALPRLDVSGVDGDISLKALIFCIVVLIFAVPLIYVFYIYEHPEQYHHDAS